MIQLFTDAATKYNPGPTGLGAVILVKQQQIQLTGHVPTASNHTGEFLAAQLGFQYLANHYSADEVVIFHTDSRLLSDAIGKHYSKHYATQLNALEALMNHFTTVVTRWIPEKQNHGAHHLANQALHQIE
ncbi:ribonuclease HI family protein [uncultured Limosilactobacillus sp.]|uniref:ribonuclease HI family protein n=1 Tax=uncultured Limosilactobacillus sp. TaxID=2837629 RepID=UPI0025CCBE1F|nr:ribonuclease HI family protein [uncultured Limosilactobacillus sp.]